jgi:quercetin dioxygenase-like cupin family protein
MATLSKPEISRPMTKESPKAGMEPLQPIVRKDGEGTALWMLGGLYEIKISSKESNGHFCTLEMTFPNGVAAPPHVHDCDEAVLVIEGTFRCHIENDVRELKQGDFAFFPKGTLEWLENVSDRTAKVLVTYTPGGMDEFFLEAGEPARTRDVPPKSTTPPDIARLSAIAKRHGLEIREPKTH